MVLVFFALLLVVMLGLAGILVDLGQMRASRREAQSISDMAATAAGKSLSSNNMLDACKDAIAFVNTNVKGSDQISDATAFCTQAGNNVTGTTCSGGLNTQAKPSASIGRYTVTVVYPVFDAEIAVAGHPGANDGTYCERMGVNVRITDGTTFSKILGASNTQTSRMAVVKQATGFVKEVPALWLLDPSDCTSLTVGGGALVQVGLTTPTVIPGLVSIDSDGDDCGGSYTIASGGSDSKLTAVGGGKISLYALPSGATSCDGSSACNQADIAAGLISPQPTSSDGRATRAPVDWKYNCKSSYPAYTASGVSVALEGCPDTATVSPYMDQLIALLGTSSPGSLPTGFQRWTDTYSCNVPKTTIDAPGNWLVDCSGGAGYVVGKGTTVNFTGGNVIFDGDVSVSGGGGGDGPGALNINTFEPARHAHRHDMQDDRQRGLHPAVQLQGFVRLYAGRRFRQQRHVLVQQHCAHPARWRGVQEHGWVEPDLVGPN